MTLFPRVLASFVAAMLLSGCALTLDLDPAEPEWGGDTGPEILDDSGIRDAGSDVAQDAAELDVRDGTVDDVGADTETDTGGDVEQDADATSAVETLCYDGIDDDGDGDTDCDDADCAAFCGVCANEVDQSAIVDDGTQNILIIAAVCIEDSDCGDSPSLECLGECMRDDDRPASTTVSSECAECFAGYTQCIEAECRALCLSDGLSLDCAICDVEAGCRAYFNRCSGLEICDNFEDDDGDGAIDCEDPTCADLCEGYPSGACTGAEVSALNDPSLDLDSVVASCVDASPQCEIDEDGNTCLTPCLEGETPPGLTTECSYCVAGRYACAIQNCLLACVGDLSSDECAMCVTSAGCLDWYNTCAGFDDCENATDDDGNGFADCSDPLCVGVGECSSEVCVGGEDEDGDGLVDCLDPDCVFSPGCYESCYNGRDDDGDDDIDCDDSSCAEIVPCVELCSNEADDNGDGLTDCADPLCADDPACSEALCDNEVDDDEDGFFDCADPDCFDSAECTGEDACYDLVDNDEDGFVDCLDSECAGFRLCGEICDNGTDDTGNGLVDCQDYACLGSEACEGASCPPGMARVFVTDGALEYFCIDVFENSRIDASADAEGLDNASGPISRPGVLPWRNISRDDASTACANAGKRLCTAEEWQRTCRGDADTEYVYGSSFVAETCNDAVAGERAPEPTGTRTSCVGSANVYDLSGNVAEWVASGSPLGGSYDDLNTELTCLAPPPGPSEGTADPTIGFRCCLDD